MPPERSVDRTDCRSALIPVPRLKRNTQVVREAENWPENDASISNNLFRRDGEEMNELHLFRRMTFDAKFSCESLIKNMIMNVKAGNPWHGIFIIHIYTVLKIKLILINYNKLC